MCYFMAAVGPKGCDYSKYDYVDEKENQWIRFRPVDNLFVETQLPKNSLLLTDETCACSSVIGSGLKDYAEDLEAAGQAQLKKKGTTEIRLKHVNEKFLRAIESNKLYLLPD